MTVYPSLARFTPTAGAVGADTQSRACVGNGRLFTMRIGNTAGDDAGLRSYNIATRAQLAAITEDALQLAGGGNNIDAPICFTPTGQLFLRTTGWGNGSGQLVLLDQSFNLLSTWNNTAPIGILPSLPSEPAIPQCFGATSKQGVSFVAMAPDATLAAQPVAIMQAGATGGGTTQFAGNAINFTEAMALCCGSPAETGKLVTIGRALAGADANPLGVYVTTIANGAGGYNIALWPGTPNPAIASVKVGTVPIASIDPTWPTTTGCTGPAYDESDGNVLVMAATDDAGAAVKVRLFKIRVTDAAVLWSSALPFLGMNEIFYAMSASTVRGGKFRFFCPADQKFYVFNTATGAVISSTHMGLGGAMTPIASLDYAPLDAVIYYGDWGAAVAPPTETGGIAPSNTPFWYLLQLAAVAGGKTQVYLIGSP